MKQADQNDQMYGRDQFAAMYVDPVKRFPSLLVALVVTFEPTCRRERHRRYKGHLPHRDHPSLPDHHRPFPYRPRCTISMAPPRKLEDAETRSVLPSETSLSSRHARIVQDLGRIAFEKRNVLSRMDPDFTGKSVIEFGAAPRLPRQSRILERSATLMRCFAGPRLVRPKKEVAGPGFSFWA
jgi:hypothetical protein